jgi:hypothetical protein
MVKVVRAPAEDSRLLMWSGRPGVRLLDLHEHRQFEQASLRRFSQERDGSIAWPAVPANLVIRAEPDTEHAIRTYLRENGDVVVMWGSLALPSLMISAAGASDRVPEILATDALLWLYRPDHQLLFERNYFQDTAVVARIPHY